MTAKLFKDNMWLYLPPSYSHTLTKNSIPQGRDVQLIKQRKVITLLAPSLEHHKQSTSADGRILTYLNTHTLIHTLCTHKQLHAKTRLTVLSHVFAPGYFQFYRREEQRLQMMDFWRVREFTTTFLKLLYTTNGARVTPYWMWNPGWLLCVFIFAHAINFQSVLFPLKTAASL